MIRSSVYYYIFKGDVLIKHMMRASVETNIVKRMSVYLSFFILQNITHIFFLYTPFQTIIYRKAEESVLRTNFLQENYSLLFQLHPNKL